MSFSAFSQISWVTSLEDDTIHGTLRYAINHAAMGADIRFSDTLFAQGSDTLHLDSTIFIKDAISIRGYMRGGDTLFISGGLSIKIFFVDLTSQSRANGVLTMDSLAFVNGSSYVGSVFDLNKIGVTYINNCFFKNNIVTYSGLIHHDNGGYPNRRADMYFKNNTFVENTGGLINIKNVGKVHMKEIYSTNNNGGVIDVHGSYKLTASQFYAKDNYTNVPSSSWLLKLGCDSLLTDSLFALNNTGFTPFKFSGRHQHHKNLYAINNTSPLAGALEIHSWGWNPPLFEDCVFKYNEGKHAGAIQANVLTMKNSIIRGNITNDRLDGEGAIWITSNGHGTISYIDCVIDSNVTINGRGGAISGETDHLYLERVAIYENDGGTYGGAVTLEFSDSLTIINSYIGDNRAPQYAGIIMKYGANYARIKNSTIYNNTCATGTGGIATAAILDISGSLIAGNTPANFGANNFVQPYMSGGYNIIQENLPLNGFQLTDIINPPSSIIPMGPLVNNGGIGLTRMPLAGNVALNQGNPNDTTSAFNSGINDGRRDIGAVESSDTSIQSYTVYYVCDSILFDGTWVKQDGYYIDSAKSSLNKDSVAILKMEVHQSTRSTDVQSSCDSLTWIDGKTYYMDNNTASVILTTKYGCDSIVTLNYTKTVDTSIRVSGNQIVSNSTNATIQWYSCDSVLQLIPNANSSVFTPSSSGSYLAVLEKNGCRDTTRCISFSDKLSLNNQLPERAVYVYPNPTENILNIEWPKDFSPMNVKVYSIHGQLITNVGLLNQNGSKQLELIELPAGCYALIFKFESGNTNKIIIRKD